MKTLKIIAAVGGRKKVIELTGLHRATISYWVQNNIVPKPWLMFFQAKFPKLNWQELLEDSPKT